MKYLLFLTLLSSHLIANESMFDGTDPMTDKELEESKTYIHQGMAERIYKDQCVNEDKTIKQDCIDGETAFSEEQKVERAIEKMMPMVGPAYSLIMGQLPVKYIEKENGGPVLTDGKNEIKKGSDGFYRDPKTGQALDPKQRKDMDLKEKTKEGQDYCGYIPTVMTTAVTFYEQTMDQQTQQNFDKANPTTRQSQSFYALAKAHKDRAKTSTVQFAGWGATAGCYAALMVTNTISANAGAIVKTGAATLLAYFYNLKTKAHKNRAKMLEELAKKYPGAGDCNPHTATTCFCNEETSPMSDPGNYQAKCVPPNYQAGFNNNSFICINANNQADPACDCKKKGTCIDTKFKTMGMQLGLNPSMMKDPLAGIGPLSSGFGTNGLDEITNRNLAFAKKALNEISPQDLNNIANMNNQKKNLAKDIASQGIPRGIAAQMASHANMGAGAPAMASSGLSGGRGINLNGQGIDNAFKANESTRFKSGGTVAGVKNNNDNPYGAFNRGKTTGAGQGGVQVMDFDELNDRAAREAEITKDTSKPIFEIITYRYKTSAWREFQEAIQKQIQEDQK
jgi:hypothetical protein